MELSADPRFGRRVRRLAATSVVALGLIWWLALVTVQAPAVLLGALVGGWGLMPLVLVLSLHRPRLRYLLIVPATLVSVALAGICISYLPADPGSRLGWRLMTGGVGLGGIMGGWLWFRWLPVPELLNDPFAGSRLALIVVHVGLIVAGMSLVMDAAIS